jgi:hypothetical protein
MYLFKHPRAGWRYQRSVPLDVRPLIGKPTIVRYIAVCPRDAAKEAARAYAADDDALFRRLRRMSQDEKQQLAAEGGIKKMEVYRQTYSDYVTMAEIAREEIHSLPPKELHALLLDRPDFAPRLFEVLNPQHEREVVAREFIETTKALRLKAEPAPEHALASLLDTWVKVKEPKVTRKHKATLALLQGFLGNVDLREVTQQDIGRFRDHLATCDLTKIVQVGHLDRVRGLFSAAVSRAIIKANPAAGIRVDGKVKKAKRLPFSGPQLRLICASAPVTDPATPSAAPITPDRSLNPQLV